MDEKVVISIVAEGMSNDAIEEIKDRLIREFNELRFQLASPVYKEAEPGARGDAVTMGQIGLALISAGLVQQVARIAVEFVKRNSQFTLQIGDIKVRKDHASSMDIKTVGEELRKLINSSKTGKSTK